MSKFKMLFLLFLIVWLSCSADNWNYVKKVVASDRFADDNFGLSVSISGEYAIVGAWHNGYNASGDNFLDNAGAAYLYHKEGSTWIQTQKIVASDRLAMANFGYTVSISGDYAVVSNSPTQYSTNGKMNEDEVSAIYIFKRIGASWIQQQKIWAPSRNSNNSNFGAGVCISGDYVIVGASSESEGEEKYVGAAYIYKRNVESWNLQNKIVAPFRAQLDGFGNAVSISGGYAVVASRGRGSSVNNDWAGAADFFKLDGENWIFQQRVYYTSSEASNFGSAVSIYGEYSAISANLDYTDSYGNIVSSNTGKGSVFIFKRIESSWVLQQKIVPSNRASSEYFGQSLSINDKYLVSSSEVDSGCSTVYIYRRDSLAWNFVQKLQETNQRTFSTFGYSVAISDEDILVGSDFNDFDENEKDSMQFSGAAYFFSKNNFSWVEKVVVNKNISLYTTADHRIVIKINYSENLMDISLFQVNGQKIVASNKSHIEDTFEYNLKPGIYILNVKYDDGQISRKIIIR